ncbi:MAG: hypothetical protein RLP02_14295, partial [Coleofasciculus sp. C2-GNP5-27]
GVDCIFFDAIFYIFPDGWGSVAAYLINFINQYPDWSNDTTDTTEVENNLNNLRKIGETSLIFSQPWIKGNKFDMHILSDNTYFPEEYLKEFMFQIPETIFGAFVLFATALEEDKRPYQNYLPFPVEDLQENDWYFFGGIRWVLIARFQPVADDKVQAEMDRCGFSPEQQGFIWRWIRREINLVADTVEEEIG